MIWQSWEDEILKDNRFFTHEELRTLFLPHRTEVAIRKRRNAVGASRLTHCKVCSRATPVLNQYHLCKDHYISLNDRKTSLTYKFAEYKKSATARGIAWNLTIEEFAEYWNSHCTYCNDKIYGIGLDRTDSSKGYNKDNVVPCCTMCNTMKMGHNVDDWLRQIKKIYEAKDGES